MSRGSTRDDEDAALSAQVADLGPAPRVSGRDRIFAAAHAKLFGPSSDSAAGPTELAARSGVLELDSDRRVTVEARDDAQSDELPERLGRFRVLSWLGRGGMGEVYEAHDPDLDRKVALKVLRPELRALSGGDAGPIRLLREAQAMARLVDPHVITVHEVGTFGDQVFVAMEFVEGQTLRCWLEQRPPWHEVLERFMRAGSGLAAAHRAGLVHRDFKPDNVLVGDDGRLRVVDFGLARAVGSGADAETVGTKTAVDRTIDPLQTPLTQSGAVMGTPAYMSPEQHAGRPADARSDQFSFCVALWEALYGRRPFEGNSYAELVRRVLEGRPQPPPSGTRVPRQIQQALERGLALEPDARWPSMDALLFALRRGRSKRWKPLGVLVGGAALGVAAAWGLFGEDGNAVDGCAAPQERMLEVWGDERRHAVRQRLASAVPAGPRIAQTSSQMLDEYARHWVEASTETCAARLVVGRRSDAILDSRDACLATRIVEMDELVAMLGQADSGLALEAVQAVATLSSVQSCVDGRRLQGWRAPNDPQTRERLGRTRAGLAAAKARGLLGRYQNAIELAQDVIDSARELDDSSTEAAGLLVRGQYEERAGKAEAESTLREAVLRAEVAGDHTTRAHALIHLVWIVGQDAKRYDESRALAAEARAVLKVLGGTPILEARLDNNLGVAAKVAREHDAARQAFGRALEAQLELFGEEHPETARTLANVGAVLSNQGDHGQAETMLRRALASFEAVLGDEHPLVAIVVANLGQNLDRQGRRDEAIAMFERSLDIRRLNFEPTHPAVAKSHFNLGIALHVAGEHARALEHFELGLASRREAGEDDMSLHPWWRGLALSYFALGRVDESIPWFERALAARREESDRALAQLRLDAAKALAHRNPAQARDLAERAASGLERHAQTLSDEENETLMQIRAWLAQN